MPIHRLDVIPVCLPEKEIMMRLGFSRHRTVINESTQKRVRAVMDKAFALCRPRGCWLRIGLASRGEKRTELDDGTVIESAALAKLLSASQSVWIAAVTAGAEISAAATESAAAGEGAAAVVFDAVGSETADAAMDWLQRHTAAGITRHGEKLTSKRFSPGYSDLPLTSQRTIFRLLELEAWGLLLTDSMMMVPEKSVTALAGIERY